LSDNVKNKLYDDIAHPIAVQTGKSLEIIGLLVNKFFSPLRNYAVSGKENTDKLENEIIDKLKDKDVNNIIAPPTHVAVPALLANSYTDAEALRSLYASLIAKSMVKQTSSDVHPAFIEIIKQLSPREALFLKAHPILKSPTPFVSIRIQKKSEYFNQMNFILHPKNILRNFQEGLDYLPFYFGDDYNNSPEEISIMIDNFIRLRVLDFVPNTVLVDRNAYSKFYKDDYTNHFEKFIKDKESHEVVHIPGLLKPTLFGTLFSSICID
jgi:hypothetical protein